MIANKKKILVTGFFKLFSYFAAIFFILVIGLFVCATRSFNTIFVRITENRDAIGIGNGSLTSRASGKPAAKAFGMIVGNQSVRNPEACRLNAAVATLDENSAAAPVVGCISRIVRDISV